MTTPYPAHIAEQVAMMRPDLATTAAGDCISAVLTADPTLTADEVIQGLDQAAAEHAANLRVCDWCERTDTGRGQYSTACPAHEQQAGRVAAARAQAGGSDSGTLYDAEISRIAADRAA